MDSTENIRSIREYLTEIEKALAWMEKSGHVHQLDIEVLLNKTRHIYEKALALAPGPVTKPEQEPKVTPEIRDTPPPPLPEQPAVVNVPEPLQEPLPEPEPEPEPEPVPPPVSQPKPQPKPIIDPEPLPIWELDEEPEWEPSLDTMIIPDHEPPVPKPQKTPVRETLAESSLFQRDDSLNEVLGKQKPPVDLASVIKETPVADIWAAITINERFLFIRELFSNDAESFKNTVTDLNRMDSWESARRYLSSHYSLDEENQVTMDFLNVVRRRFLK